MDTAGEFEWYADWVADRSPLYERLARGVADDPALLDIAAEARDAQPAPQLLLGAVHAHLLDGNCASLAAFYPTCTDDPTDPAEADPFPSFRACCLDNEADLREVVASRRVQTNAVGRSAVLLPAFERVRRIADDPLVLVEIGASAGLNLYWDRYRYEYDETDVCGDPDSPVRIETDVRGDYSPPLPETPPAVRDRVGVDLNPLDVTDEGDSRWLRSLVIPGQRRRHERLAAAIGVAYDDPPELVTGDALDVLPEVLRGVPADATCCVFSTHTLYQFEEADVRELRRLLGEFGRERPLHWVSGDPFADADAPTVRHVRFADGAAEETRLATYESYGAWIRWLAAKHDRADSPE